MYLVRGVWRIGDRSLRIAVGAGRNIIVGQRGTRRTTCPAVSTGRFLWADGDLPWSYGHDAREYRLDLYSAQPQPNSLRTSRLGLSSEAAHSQ